MLNFLSRNSDNLLVGAFLGVGPLGPVRASATRSSTRLRRCSSTPHASSPFRCSRASRTIRERTRRAYGRVNRALSTIILPGYIGLSLVAQEASSCIFGKQWTDSGPVAATLYLIGPVLTLQVFSGALLNAAGHPDITFRFRLITTAVHVIGFFIAVSTSRTSWPWRLLS